jgi:hypothetical protein
LRGDVIGKIIGPGSNGQRHDWFGQLGGKLVERHRRGSSDGCSHFGHESLQRVIAERVPPAVHRMRAAFMMDRRRRQACFDQLDPPSIHNRVVRRSRHDHGPAKMMGDADAHRTILPARAHQITAHQITAHGSPPPAASPPTPSLTLVDMAMGGGDFSLGARNGALDATAAAATADANPHHHFPYARRLHLGWHQNVDGRWIAAREDEHRWEVICAECGDTDGPAENQSIPVQRLRGPYVSKHRATHAATRHFEQL